MNNISHPNSPNIFKHCWESCLSVWKKVFKMWQKKKVLPKGYVQFPLKSCVSIVYKDATSRRFIVNKPSQKKIKSQNIYLFIPPSQKKNLPTLFFQRNQFSFSALVLEKRNCEELYPSFRKIFFLKSGNFQNIFSQRSSFFILKVLF